jgi:hypothetical protein
MYRISVLSCWGGVLWDSAHSTQPNVMESSGWMEWDESKYWGAAGECSRRNPMYIRRTFSRC